MRLIADKMFESLDIPRWLHALIFYICVGIGDRIGSISGFIVGITIGAFIAIFTDMSFKEILYSCTLYGMVIGKEVGALIHEIIVNFLNTFWPDKTMIAENINSL